MTRHGLDRRTFLRQSASAAVVSGAGLAGCRDGASPGNPDGGRDSGRRDRGAPLPAVPPGRRITQVVWHSHLTPTIVEDSRKATSSASTTSAWAGEPTSLSPRNSLRTGFAAWVRMPVTL
jgi:hypothetical protein